MAASLAGTGGPELGGRPTLPPAPAVTGLGMDGNYSGYDSAGGQGDYVSAFDLAHVRWVFIVLYVIVFACCFFGNLFVILVVVRHRKMRTITNFFLANLAGADLCVGIFCVLPNLSIQINPVWKLGKVMCKLYYFVQAMSYASSIMILTAISIERYFAIIHPMRSKQLTTLCLLRIVVLIVWTIAAASATPYLVIYDTLDIQDMQFCMPLRPFNSRVYVTISFMLWYVIPLLLMSVMYTKISIVLWKTSRPDNLEKNSFKTKRLRPKRKKKGMQLITFGRCNKTVDDKHELQLCKPVIYVSGIVTSASSDEATQDETHHAPYQKSAAVAGEKPFLKATSGSGYDSTTEVSATDDALKEQSSDEAEDYEDDWPASDKLRRGGEEYPMKQVYTFRNPSYSGTCPACQQHKAGSMGGNHQTEKCACKSASATPTMTPKLATTVTGSAGKVHVKPARKKPHKKTENALVARRRVIRLLIAVIVSFALCVIPYHIRLLWTEWSTPTLSVGETLVPPITFLLYYFNSGLNPILYAFLSDNFRRSLREVLCCTIDENSKRRSMRSTMSVKTMNSTI